MIKLTRLNKSEFYLNPHQMEFMESTPDTVIRMLSERRVIVQESCDEVLSRIIAYRQRIGVLGNDTTV